jgi:prepilin-type N-terminal cleavage/methylation domain-containing protein
VQNYASIPTTISPRRGRGSGFTLTELLLVIAIVSLLVSLLLPALGAARETARATRCLTNARTLASAVLVYAGDYRSVAPPGASDFLRNRDRWHGTRARTGVPFDPAGGPLSAYLGQELGASAAQAADTPAAGPRSCPTFVPTLRRLADARVGFERACGGYGYNNAFLGVHRRPITTSSGQVWVLVSDRRGSAIDRFTHPARVVVFADAALADGSSPADDVIEYSFIEPRFWPDQPGQRPDPSIHFRHGKRPGGPVGRASAAFLDGSARLEHRTFTANSGIFTLPRTDPGVGWFGDADDNRAFGYD